MYNNTQLLCLKYEQPFECPECDFECSEFISDWRVLLVLIFKQELIISNAIQHMYKHICCAQNMNNTYSNDNEKVE